MAITAEKQAASLAVMRVDSTLHKGLQILEALATSPRSLGITELSSLLELNKSNVHRLVKTLRAMNYVVQNEDRSYRATMKLWKLGSSVMSHVNLVQLCIGEMNKLAQRTGESVHLSVLDGLRLLYIEKIDSAQSVRAYSERGGNAPLHCTATGKVLLAYSYDALREPISKMLDKHTVKTITSIRALDGDISAVRNAGYSVNVGEYRADVGGVAAPIFDADGKILAAIGISGPLSRLTKPRIKELTAVVVASAKAASAAIGSLQG
jgi:DNA-binding IclR family transcriptional regulator